MAENRPKLVISGANDEVAARIEHALGGEYEVRAAAVSPDGAAGWSSSLLESIGEGVCLTDAGGGMVWSNARCAALDEGTRERLAGICRTFARSGRAEPQEFEFSSPDEARHFEASVTHAGGAAASGLLAVVVREVTGEKRRQQKLDAIERAGAELVRLDADLIRRTNSVERLKHMEAKIVSYARNLLHFDHFGIRMLDPRTGKLELVISSGLPPSYAEIDIYPIAEGNGTSGYVAATGRSYICDDTANDPLFLPGLTGARSSLTVPLKLEERVIGILNTESQSPKAFGQEDRQFAEIFARSIAMALHILDLLVVERSSTNQSVSGRVVGELSGPLQDIISEVAHLNAANAGDEATRAHVARIIADVESIKSRVRDVAAGPTTLLDVERALADKTIDPAMSGRRILVADDEAKIRRIIGDVLRNRGCEVTVCDSGATAIAALNELFAAGKRFDLIISDIRMPDRNGYEVFSAARRLLGEIPVILMTGFGYDPHHSIVRASQEGLQCVLFKPFQIEQLVDTVKQALKGK